MINKAPLLLLLCLCTGFFSCKKSNEKPVVANKGKDLVLTAAEQQKVGTDNTFNFQLFDNLAAGNATSDNLFISPLSVGFAMAMVNNGANGQTLSAIQNTMGFAGFTQDQLNAYYNNLITNLPELDPNTTLKIANSIWYRNSFSVLPAFTQTNTTDYNAKIQALDFNSPSAVATINNWVSAQTNGKIPSIVNIIPPTEEMYLINALYFKSSWQDGFDAQNTKPGPFYLTGGAQTTASFMTGNIGVNSCSDNNATVIELPYSNAKYSMVIVEPQAIKTVNDIIGTLDATQWQTWMNALMPSEEALTMPKFTFSYSANLNNSLSALGMGIAFTTSADFSKINSQVQLQISDVEHKAFVAVDESGTEAAAVTSVGVATSVAIQNPPSYVINRPFIFAIREIKSGLILFTGIVNNPAK